MTVQLTTLLMGAALLGLLVAVLDVLQDLRKGQIEMNEKLQALLAEVQALTTVIDSAEALLTQLHDLLVAAQGDPAAVQEIIDMLATQKAELADSVVANTPSEE